MLFETGFYYYTAEAGFEFSVPTFAFQLLRLWTDMHDHPQPRKILAFLILLTLEKLTRILMRLQDSGNW